MREHNPIDNPRNAYEQWLRYDAQSTLEGVFDQKRNSIPYVWMVEGHARRHR